MAKTMEKLDELLAIDGVVAVGEFANDGTLVAYRSNMNMPPEMARKSAQFCATVTMMFSTLAGAFEQLPSMKFAPQQGWAYSGGDLTVAVGGHIGVFIKTEKANFNQLFQALVA
jgi:roadblock/LC7 domain-containing protein